MRVLVTGAAGFVGRPLVARLRRAGMTVVPVVRNADPAFPDAVAIGDLAGAVDWSRPLEGVEAVAHLAARVHVMRDRAADPDAAFAAVNVHATMRLAEAARRAGVRRLVFLSTVKVLGERTLPGRPFRDGDPPAPEDAYGRSKRDAEAALASLAGLETATIRPPLVYGPDVRGNLRALARLVRSGVPLPFAGLRARRSLVGVANLAAAVELCLRHPDAAGGRYLVADWHPTTAELATALAAADGRPARLWPLPPVVFRMAARLGAGAAIARLTQPLEVDPAGLARLGWRPETAPADELARLMRAL